MRSVCGGDSYSRCCQFQAGRGAKNTYGSDQPKYECLRIVPCRAIHCAIATRHCHLSCTTYLSVFSRSLARVISVLCCFAVTQLSCPWGLGQWRGEWSSDSVLWERYPSIKAELLHPRQQEVGAGVQDGRSDDNLRGAGGAANQGKTTREKGTSFWMAFEDFTAEFSQARKRWPCVSSTEARNPKPIDSFQTRCPGWIYHAHRLI